MRNKRVILTAGGTGGHLFPAQAVADKLQGQSDILFVGGGLNSNRYFDQNKYPFQEISTSTLSLRHPFKAIKASWSILKGVFQSFIIFKKFKPDLVVGFGSFFTFPLLLAAKIKKIPILLHEQNSLPGKVNRLFARSALLTAITFPETALLIQGKSERVSFPLRFSPKRVEKKEALEYFGLDFGKRTLLIFGGSQGGSGLNRLFMEAASSLPNDVQIIHFTGNKEVKEKALELYQKLKLTCVVKEFEVRMDHAWSLADLAFTRAGAATIAELIAWEVPAILIPFPFATDGHQEKNGEHFTACVKGGSMFLEGKTNGKELQKVLDNYLRSDLMTYKDEIRRYKNTHKCKELHELILEVKHDG